jgi:hypothetical protein
MLNNDSRHLELHLIAIVYLPVYIIIWYVSIVFAATLTTLCVGHAVTSSPIVQPCVIHLLALRYQRMGFGTVYKYKTLLLLTRPFPSYPELPPGLSWTLATSVPPLERTPLSPFKHLPIHVMEMPAGNTTLRKLTRQNDLFHFIILIPSNSGPTSFCESADFTSTASQAVTIWSRMSYSISISERLSAEDFHLRKRTSMASTEWSCIATTQHGWQQIYWTLPIFRSLTEWTFSTLIEKLFSEVCHQRLKVGFMLPCILLHWDCCPVPLKMNEIQRAAVGGNRLGTLLQL